MTNSIGDHLQRLQTSSRRCIEQTLDAHGPQLGEVHLLDEDMATWVAKIVGVEREQLSAARRELAFAEYAVASGLYRQAYATLRLFLELSFAAVHFSVHEFERRQWVSDRADFSWSGALDVDQGVLAAAFVREFAPHLKNHSRAYAQAAAAAYRHCSQFVHGKATASSALPLSIEYRRTVVEDWCSTAISCGRAVLFLLLVRYGDDLDAYSDDVLSTAIAGRFGQLSEVREKLGLAEEG